MANLQSDLRYTLRQVDVSNARPSLIALAAAVVAVLLLACLNLAGLMTARSIARRGDIALRAALGARRGQMLRLNSSLSYTAVDGLGRADSVSILGNRGLAIALSGAAMLVATIAASLIPARRTACLEPTEALRAE